MRPSASTRAWFLQTALAGETTKQLPMMVPPPTTCGLLPRTRVSMPIGPHLWGRLISSASIDGIHLCDPFGWGLPHLIRLGLLEASSPARRALMMNFTRHHRSYLVGAQCIGAPPIYRPGERSDGPLADNELSRTKPAMS